MKTEQFKAMKFRVDNPEHSRQIQERLFEMGYKWCLIGEPDKTISFTDKPFLYAKNESLTFGEYDINFISDEALETTLSDISPWQPKQGEIIEVSNNDAYWEQARFICMDKGMYIGHFIEYNGWKNARPHNPHREEIERLKARLKELEGEC